mmetsp:Transcript_3637/g.4931  ORF Transcript_3637/g.4931 Transcript_3637/m.4931 type:complete len:86 (-) Transcript_3637:106-363(-)
MGKEGSTWVTKDELPSTHFYLCQFLTSPEGGFMQPLHFVSNDTAIHISMFFNIIWSIFLMMRMQETSHYSPTQKVELANECAKRV